MLNEEILQWGYWDYCMSRSYYMFLCGALSSVVNWQEYTRCIHIFLTGLGTVMEIDLSRHSLVGIGHSMGACAL